MSEMVLHIPVPNQYTGSVAPSSAIFSFYLQLEWLGAKMSYPLSIPLITVMYS